MHICILNIISKQMKLGKFYRSLLAVSMAVAAIASCKDDDDEEYDYMSGSVDFDFPTYVVVGQVVDTYVSGITSPSDPTYFWYSPNLDISETDTVYSQNLTVTIPDESGSYTLTAYARKDGYYSSTKTVNIKAINPDDGLTGWQYSFTTFTDPRDGQLYHVRDYGSLTWFVQDLRYMGDGVGSAYEHSDEVGNVFGRLYSWNDATGGEAGTGLGGGPQGVCPDGWSIPTREDWEDFAKAVSGEDLPFEEHWIGLGETASAPVMLNNEAMWPYSPDNLHTNTTGWNAFPTGNSTNSYEDFENIATYGMWWSSYMDDAGMVYYRYIYYNSDTFDTYYTDKDSYGVSVRCVKLINK